MELPRRFQISRNIIPVHPDDPGVIMQCILSDYDADHEGIGLAFLHIHPQIRSTEGNVLPDPGQLQLSFFDQCFSR